MARVMTIMVLVGIGAAVALVATTLPWWATLTMLVLGAGALVALVPLLIGAGLRGVARSLFEAKSRVLRGATARVHSAEWCDRPACLDEDDDCSLACDEIDEDARFLAVEVTVTPGSCDGPMEHWDPWDLVLVPFDAEVSMEQLEREDKDEVFAEPADAHMVSGEEADKVIGEHRVRLVFVCPQELSGRVKFRYFFEAFGGFDLPPAGDGAAQRAA